MNTSDTLMLCNQIIELKCRFWRSGKVGKPKPDLLREAIQKETELLNAHKSRMKNPEDKKRCDRTLSYWEELSRNLSD